MTDEWQQRLATGGENDSPARELARTIRDAAARFVPDMTVKIVYRRDRYLRGGDHIPFLAQGLLGLLALGDVFAEHRYAKYFSVPS